MNIKVNIKFLITIATIILVLFLMGTFSLATEEYSVFISLKSNSTLKEGQIVNVNVDLSSINAGNGIDVIVARLNYDTNVFEVLTSRDLKSNTGWHISYEPTTNMLTGINNTKVTQKQNIFTITFKVKSTVNVDSTTIKLQKITASGGRVVDGGTGNINVNNTSITIKKPVQQIIPVQPTNYSVSMSLTNTLPLVEGQIVTVNANLTNVNAGNGIDVIVAKLNYDTNVFEPISTSNFSSNTGWSISYSPKTNMLTAIKSSNVKQAETVFSIKFKVKSTVDINSTTISLVKITTSGGKLSDGGTGDISVNNANINLNKVINVPSNSTNTTTDPVVENKNNVEIIETVAAVKIPNIDLNKNENIDKNQDISVDTDTVIDIDENIITEEIVISKIDTTDVVTEKVKVSDINVKVTENENDDIKKVECTIIASASSVSFVSLLYVLIRRLILGI